VCGRDGDATFSFLRSFINGTIFEEVCKALFGLSLRNRRGEGGFAVVDVADCAFKTLAANSQFHQLNLVSPIFTCGLLRSKTVA
jgi:hypothetical protein